jgi:hypothetical protein
LFRPQLDVPGRAKVWKAQPKPKTIKGKPFEIEWRPFSVKSHHCRLFKVRPG